MVAEHSKTVSLVLGGGGARGLAHIGVIQWLTENGYNIRSIAGSSMGALVGGIIQQDGALQVALERFTDIRRRRLARQGAHEVARPRHFCKQLAVRDVARQVLLDLGPTLFVELALEVSTQLGFDLFGVLGHGFK